MGLSPSFVGFWSALHDAAFTNRLHHFAIPLLLLLRREATLDDPFVKLIDLPRGDRPARAEWPQRSGRRLHTRCGGAAVLLLRWSLPTLVAIRLEDRQYPICGIA